jgi:hypothetical protein
MRGRYDQAGAAGGRIAVPSEKEQVPETPLQIYLDAGTTRIRDVSEKDRFPAFIK